MIRKVLTKISVDAGINDPKYFLDLEAEVDEDEAEEEDEDEADLIRPDDVLSGDEEVYFILFF